jgi:hypothetical protein
MRIWKHLPVAVGVGVLLMGTVAQAKPKNKAGYDATAAAAGYKNYGQYKKWLALSGRGQFAGPATPASP